MDKERKTDVVFGGSMEKVGGWKGIERKREKEREREREWERPRHLIGDYRNIITYLTLEYRTIQGFNELHESNK